MGERLLQTPLGVGPVTVTAPAVISSIRARASASSCRWTDANGVVNVRRVPGSHDRHVDPRACEGPGHCQPAHGGSELLLGECLEGGDGLKVATESRPVEDRTSATPVIGGESGRMAEATAEEAVRERSVSQDTDFVDLCVRKDPGFDLALEQAVGRLQCLDWQNGAELRHPVDVEIRHADMDDLAVGHELGEGRGSLLERRTRGRASGPDRGRWCLWRAPADSPRLPGGSRRGSSRMSHLRRRVGRPLLWR